MYAPTTSGSMAGRLADKIWVDFKISLQVKLFSRLILLNQASTWFLRIAFVCERLYACVCLCVCLLPKLLVTSGVI